MDIWMRIAGQPLFLERSRILVTDRISSIEHLCAHKRFLPVERALIRVGARRSFEWALIREGTHSRGRSFEGALNRGGSKSVF
jgi:hypothetical protein